VDDSVDGSRGEAWTKAQEKSGLTGNLLSGNHQEGKSTVMSFPQRGTLVEQDPVLLSIHLFGPFAVRVNGEPMPCLRSRKEQSLLALLALRHGREIERAWLAGTLWSDTPASRALATLRRALYDLRRALGVAAACLDSPTPHTLRLVPPAEADVVAFDAATTRGDVASLEVAVALYRGPLLEGCEEEWVFEERRAREQTHLTALERLAEHAMGHGEHASAVHYLRRMVTIEPLREAAQRALMTALAAGGNYAAALQTYRDLRLLLHGELNTEPAPETSTLFQQIRAEARRRSSIGRREGAVADAPSTTHLMPPTCQIPRPLTGLIGRESEVQQTRSALAAARLVTLTGAGGVGKTRLAIQVAEEVTDDYRDGVRFVELGALMDPTLVPQTVAAVLGIREQSGRSLTETLRKFLGPMHLLLVLDNCEHLTEACASLAGTLLHDAPDLRVLVTSRQAMGLMGERLLRVASLSFPDPHAPGLGCRSPEALMAHAAVRLFVERAVAATSAFALTERNAPAVVQVCARLDGIPLAIELAAARMKALSVEQLNERLDCCFQLLTGGSRTALPRHQTMRGLIDWSYDLLSEPERTLLRRLSVFAGGWTLETAEAICRDFGLGTKPEAIQNPKSEIQNVDVLDLLTSLVDKSLVVVDEPRGRTRYRLLETVRQYARDRLLETEEATPVRGRHRDFFLAQGEKAEPRLSGPEQATWLDWLESERDNFRAALVWALDSDPEAALRLAGALVQFWLVRGHWTEGREALERALERGVKTPAEVRAKALRAAAYVTALLGDFEAATPLGEESLDLSQCLGDKASVARSLHTLGDTASLKRDLEAARRYYEESLVIKRAIGDQEGIALSLSGLADLTFVQGDHERARALHAESLTIMRKIGNKQAITHSLTMLGFITVGRGEYEAARALHEEGLALQREIGDKMHIGMSMLGLGYVARWQSDYKRARGLYLDCLAIFREIGDKQGIAYALGGLGAVAWAQGDHEAAGTFHRENLELARELGDRREMGRAMCSLGNVAYAKQEYGRACRYFAESVVMVGPIGHKRDIASGLEGLAKVWATSDLGYPISRCGRTDRDIPGEPADAAVAAARLFGAAEALREAALAPFLPAERADCERAVAVVRTTLAEDVFAAAWAEGRAMSPEQAIAYDLEPSDALPSEGR
jgi:predicted ATPase/DNA-binding SARP family transcriptional activator